MLRAPDDKEVYPVNSTEVEHLLRYEDIMLTISVLIADDIATTRKTLRLYIWKKKSKLSGKLQMGKKQ